MFVLLPPNISHKSLFMFQLDESPSPEPTECKMVNNAKAKIVNCIFKFDFACSQHLANEGK